MPKLITTRTRIAYLGKPRTTIIGGGFAGLEVAKELETSSIVFPFRRRFKNDDFFFASAMS